MYGSTARMGNSMIRTQNYPTIVTQLCTGMPFGSQLQHTLLWAPYAFVYAAQEWLRHLWVITSKTRRKANRCTYNSPCGKPCDNWFRSC